MKFTSAFLALTAAFFVSAAPSPRPDPQDASQSGPNHGGNFNSSPAFFTPPPFTRGGTKVYPQSTSAKFSSTSENPSTVSSTSVAPSTRGTMAPSSASASLVTSSRPRASSSIAPSSTAAPAPPGTPDGDVVGAVYFTTNNPDGNSVVIASIGSNGNVTYAGTISTGGNGEHGNDGGALGPDATFSNSIITVHSGRQLLATTNAMSNTVVLFKIDEQDPTQLTMLGAPVTSMGDYPASVTFDQAGDKLCVMNAGATATVFCYDVNEDGLAPQASSLRDIPGYNQTTPPTGPSNTASAIAFTEDQQNLVVAVKGTISPQAPGFLVVWPIASDGSLTEDPTIVPNSGPGDLSFSLTPVPGRNAFVSADALSAVDVFDLSGPLDEVSKNGATSSVTVDGNMILCWSSYSPTLDRYYISAPVAGLVVEVELDDNLIPTIIGNHNVVQGGANIDLAVGTINGQDYIYTLLGNELSIAVLRLDGPGQVTNAGVANLGPSVTRAGTPIRDNFVQGIAVYTKAGSS